MIRPLRELPEVLDAARAGDPRIAAGLLSHDGASRLAAQLPDFGPAVVHRALLALVVHSASRIVSPDTDALVDAATAWVVCPCASHADALADAIAADDRLASMLPVLTILAEVSRGGALDVLAEAFQLAAVGAGTLLPLDAVIAELRAWMRIDPRVAEHLDDRRVALVGAATEGDAIRVQQLVADLAFTRSSWHQLPEPDRTALEDALAQAFRRRHREVVAALLEAGVPTGPHTISPLSSLRTWEVEDVALVRLLLRHGGRPDGHLRFEHPLHEAVEKGWTATVKALLAAGADIEGRRDGRTALHVAATGDAADLVELLLRFGASPLAQDGAGALPVEHASEVCRPRLAAATREASASPGRALDRRPLAAIAVIDRETVVTAGGRGLHRWDVRRPDHPALVVRVELDRVVRDVLVLGPRLVTIGQGTPHPPHELHPPGYPTMYRLGVEARSLDDLDRLAGVDVEGNAADPVLAASRDGRFLAVGGQHALAVLDAATLDELADGNPDGVIEDTAALAFHPRLDHLAAITTDLYGCGASLDVFAFSDGHLGPRVTVLAPPPGWLTEPWWATHLTFDRTGSRLHLSGGAGTAQGRITCLDWSVDGGDRVTATLRWTARGDALLVFDDSTLVVAADSLYLHVLDADDGSLRQVIELDRPMHDPSLARDGAGRVWVAGSFGLTFTDALVAPPAP